MSSAYGLLGRSATTFPEADISAYMNPYSRAVTDIAAREAERAWGVDRKRISDAAVKAGAFGGSRHGIAEAEGRRNLDQQLSDIYLKGGESAFRTAGQLFNADADRLLRAGTTYGALAGQDQAYGLKDAAALGAIGEAQQNLDQRSLDLAYGNFREQRDYPREQVNWLSNIIKGTSLPSGTTTTGQQLVPQSSPLAQVAGLATTGLGLYGLLSRAKGGRVRRYADGGRIEGEEQFSNLNVSGLRAILADEQAFSPAKREIVRRMLLRATAPTTTANTLSRIAESPTPIAPGMRPPVEQRNIPAAPQSEFERQYYESLNREAERRALPPPGTADVPPPRPYPPGMYPAEAAPPPEATTPPSEAAPPMVPGSSPAAGQPPPSTREARTAGGARATGSALESIQDKVFAPYAQSPDVTTPVVEKLPEPDKLDEKASPWMAITKAGLAMMAAKPGQSALGAIGEGGLAGLTQYATDVADARKNKQTNFENALRSAEGRIKLAQSENDRVLREKQVKLAERDHERAERALLMDFAKGKDLHLYHQKSLALQGASISKNPYQMQTDVLTRTVGDSMGLPPDPTKWTAEQRKAVAEKVLEMHQGARNLWNHDIQQSRLQLSTLQARAKTVSDQLRTELPGSPAAKKLAVELQTIRDQMSKMGYSEPGLDPALADLFKTPPTR